MEKRRRAGAYEEGNVRASKTRKPVKKSGIFFKIVAVIFVIMTGIFFGYLVKFNMLPGIYLSIMGISLAVLTALCVWGLVKKSSGKGLKIVITVFLVAVMGIYVFGINYISSTMTFIGAVTTEVEETEDYYVVTLKTSKYASIEDLAGKNLHTFMAGEDYSDVKAGITAKASVNFKEDESLQILAEDLLANKTYAILISNSQYQMIKDDYQNFETDTRIIYTVTHKITGDNIADPNEAHTGKYTIESGKFNVYISGIDTAGKISNVARSDANIIVTVDTVNHEILLTSIPRDYYVTLHSKHAKDKLTHAGVYGIKETYTTVEDLLDIDINYYVRVNFTTLEKLVNALGGVDVNSEYAFSSCGYSFRSGMNHLNGAKALVFSRERYSFPSGDRQRIKNQQAVIEGIMKKALSSSTILTKYTAILGSLSNSFQTNISTDEINSVVKGQINNLSGWTINTQTLNGSGASLGTYTYGSQKLYVMIPDSTSVANAKDGINRILGAE